MRRAPSRTFSSRSGMLSSVGLLLAVGLAIALECQQLTRTVQSDTHRLRLPFRLRLPRFLPRINLDTEIGLPPGCPWSLRFGNPGSRALPMASIARFRTRIRAITARDSWTVCSADANRNRNIY
jgi:hypothetical protein